MTAGDHARAAHRMEEEPKAVGHMPPSSSFVAYLVSVPLAGPSNWKTLRDRPDPDTPGRFPADWRAGVAQIRESGKAVILSGGHLPRVDHAVPPSVSWANFVQFLKARGGRPGEAWG